MFHVINDPNRTQAGRMATSYADWLMMALRAQTLTTRALVASNPMDIDILVSYLPLAEARAACPPGVHLLLPLQEDGSRQRNKLGPICLPFGSRDSGKRAAIVAFALAKQLEIEIVATHTTYRKDGVKGDDPQLHLIEAAHKRSLELIAQARANDVVLRFNFQLADEVPNCVMDAAIENDCSLIVMARGDVLFGSNAERVAQCTHIPILIVDDERKGNS